MKAIRRIIALVLILATLVIPMTACSLDYKYVKMTVEGYGDVIIKVDMKAAPVTAKNFIRLVKDDFYDGLSFHRVMEGFMIQGGMPKDGKTPKPIFGEFLLNGYDNPIKHERGVISMARTNEYNSASCQFFICNSTTQSVRMLDGAYAAFGWVVEGMDVVDAITSNTAPFGNYNGIILDQSKQAVISEMKVIKYKESN